MFGRTGAGKSTLLNILLGKDVENEEEQVFKIGHGLESCTISPQEELFKIGKKTIQAVDVPGLDDNRQALNLDVYATTAVQTSMGLNVGLYIIDITNSRANTSDIKGLQMLQRLLDTGDE